MFRNEELKPGQALMFDLFRFLTLFSSSQPLPRPIDEGRLGGLTWLSNRRLTNNSSVNGRFRCYGPCDVSIITNYGENKISHQQDALALPTISIIM